MSSIEINDAASAARKVDTIQRTDGADTVETQAIAVINPTTGDPLLPDGDGALPVTVQSLPLPSNAATQTTLAALNVIAAAVQAAVEAINGKTTAVNTGAIAGTVALDAPTLAALESITASTGGLTDAQLRASALDVAGTFWQATQPVSASALPLPSGAATDAAIEARLPLKTSSIPMDHTEGLPVRQIPVDLWRCSFADVGSGIQTSDLTTLQTGAGQAINQSAGNLVITSGTTANAETLIRSTRTFNGALQLRYKTILSQRIANNNFSVELADIVGTGLSYTINSATSVTVTFPAGTNPYSAKNVGQFTYLSVITGAAGIPGRYAVASATGDTVTFTVAAWPATGSGTLMLWGWNYYRALYTGTTATNVAFDAQRKGWATGDSTLTINTTASPGHVGHLQSNASLAAYSDALVATSAAYQLVPRGSRIENIPDDDDPLYLFIRVLNGTTAPASTTTWTVGFVSVEMTGRQKVYVSGADQNGAPFATPVQVVGGLLATQPVSGTVTATVTSTRITPNAADGHSTYFHLISAATTNDTLVLTGARAIGLITATNSNAAARYLKVYNKATAPTSGDTPVMTVLLPPGQTTVIGGNSPIRVPLGLGIRLTTGIAVADTGAVSASEHAVSIAYT